jgi:hypothetical protein
VHIYEKSGAKWNKVHELKEHNGQVTGERRQGDGAGPAWPATRSVLAGVVWVAMKRTLIPVDLGTIKMAQWIKGV